PFAWPFVLPRTWVLGPPGARALFATSSARAGAPTRSSITLARKSQLRELYVGVLGFVCREIVSKAQRSCECGAKRRFASGWPTRRCPTERRAAQRRCAALGAGRADGVGAAARRQHADA